MRYPLLNVFLTMMWFSLWILWLYLVVSIVVDIFRSPDLGGWAKAGWVAFVIVLPFFGVLPYLIVRGDKVSERWPFPAQRQEPKAGAGSGDGAGAGAADELKTLTELKQRGVISDAEFEREKAKIVS
jgi:Short C-terminal domain/Phospholipase_D-nuclease N-terminal